jgi:hypothetical protein
LETLHLRFFLTYNVVSQHESNESMDGDLSY